MSENEQTSGPSAGKLIVVGVLGVLLLGGCLIACAGVAGVGFMLPVVRQRLDAEQRAEAAARQAVENAAQAEAARGKATEAEKPAATDETAQPAADTVPPNDEP